MRSAVVLLCVFVLSAALFGQSNYASVSGKVTDAQSLPIAHATVLFTSSSNGTESASFEFRGEAFNVLNMVNLGTPNRFVNTPQFGTITMAMTPPREIQLSARVSF